MCVPVGVLRPDAEPIGNGGEAQSRLEIPLESGREIWGNGDVALRNGGEKGDFVPLRGARVDAIRCPVE